MFLEIQYQTDFFHMCVVELQFGVTRQQERIFQKPEQLGLTGFHLKDNNMLQNKSQN